MRVRAGEAVIFDNSMPHASCHNLRDGPRLATATTLIPDDAVPAFYVNSEEPGGGIEIYRAFNEFSYSDILHGKMPARDTWELLGTLPNRNVQLNEAQFDALLANGAHIAAGVDPYAAVAALDTVPVAKMPVPTPPPRPLFRRALGRLQSEAGKLLRATRG